MNAPRKPEVGDIERAVLGHPLALGTDGTCGYCEAQRRGELREYVDAAKGDPRGRVVRVEVEVTEG